VVGNNPKSLRQQFLFYDSQYGIGRIQAHDFETIVKIPNPAC
jgi:hypothetical protein